MEKKRERVSKGFRKVTGDSGWKAGKLAFQVEGGFVIEPELERKIKVSSSFLPRTGTAVLTWGSKFFRHIGLSKWPL